MSLRSDGSYRCDRCGVDVGNAAVTECAILCDLDPDQPGTLRYLHLCRASCVAAVLGGTALADWTAARNPTKGTPTV